MMSTMSLMICLCVCFRIRLFGARFTPESISLNAGRTVVGRPSRSRNMKEKLLREGAAMDTLEDTEMQTGSATGCHDDSGLENTPGAATYVITSGSSTILQHHADVATTSSSSPSAGVTQYSAYSSTTAGNLMAVGVISS